MCRLRASKRRGLTLIELVVVLVIVVALGGIAVATIPNLLNRTHVATVAATLPAVDAAIKQHALLNSGAIGNFFDSLIDQDGNVAPFVNNSGAYTTYDLEPPDVAALNAIGISALVAADKTATNVTFEGHPGVAVPLAAGSKVAVLSAAKAAEILLNVWNVTADPVNKRYIVVGLGPRSTLVGAGENAHFSEAPVHFVDAHKERASNAYARVMLVIELAGAGTPDAEARYIGAGAPHPDGIQGVATHLKEFYNQ